MTFLIADRGVSDLENAKHDEADNRGKKAREILREVGWSTTVHHVGMVCAILRKYEVTRK